MANGCDERSVLRGAGAVRLFNELARKRLCGLVLPRTVGPASFFRFVATVLRSAPLLPLLPPSRSSPRHRFDPLSRSGPRRPVSKRELKDAPDDGGGHVVSMTGAVRSICAKLIQGRCPVLIGPSQSLAAKRLR